MTVRNQSWDICANMELVEKFIYNSFTYSRRESRAQDTF